MAQPLVMAVRASSGGQSARTTCTHAGKIEHKSALLFNNFPTIGDLNRQLLWVSLHFRFLGG